VKSLKLFSPELDNGGFQYTDFQKTHDYSKMFCGHLVWGILSILDEKLGRYTANSHISQ
jgi:hypothetical protein